MPAVEPPVENGAPPRSELEQIQMRAGQVTDEVSPYPFILSYLEKMILDSLSVAEVALNLCKYLIDLTLKNLEMVKTNLHINFDNM